MITFDVTKDERQEESITRWLNNSGVGGIDAAPRFGKTEIGLKIIKRVIEHKPGSKIVIVVPSEIIQKHWTEKVTDDVLIVTAHKAKLNLNEILVNPIRVLIIDEIHKFSSDDNKQLLKDLWNNSKFRLALSGSYPRDRFYTDMFPIVDTITEIEAIKKGWVSDFIEYNIPVQLGKKDRVRYEKYSKLISETLNLFKGKTPYINKGVELVKSDMDLIYACYSGKRAFGKYIPGEAFRMPLVRAMGWSQDMDLSKESAKQINHYWNPNNLYERCKEFKHFVQNRNEILINNEEKLEAVLRLVENNTEPTIIYNSSIDFVNTIAGAIGNKAIQYHSKMKSAPVYDPDTGDFIRQKNGKVKVFGATRMKTKAIEGIKSGKYLYLVTVKSLDEGLDIPELEKVIITAGSANPIQQIQRSARGKTISGNKEKITKIYNLYIEDFISDFGELVKSRDKTKLIERQKNYKHSVKWLTSIDDLTL